VQDLYVQRCRRGIFAVRTHGRMHQLRMCTPKMRRLQGVNIIKTFDLRSETLDYYLVLFLPLSDLCNSQSKV